MTRYNAVIEEHHVDAEYRDSRRAAYRILSPGRKFALRRLVLFVLVSLAVIWVWRTLTGGLPI